MRIASILLCSLLASPLFSADADQGWRGLSELEKSQKVTVHLWSGRTHTGTLQQVESGRLTLVESAGPVVLEKDDIAKVTKRSRGRGAMWGGIVGFGIGAPIGGAGTTQLLSHPTGRDYAAMTVAVGAFWGGIGAGIGAAIGKERTLYRGTQRP